MATSLSRSNSTRPDEVGAGLGSSEVEDGTTNDYGVEGGNSSSRRLPVPPGPPSSVPTSASSPSLSVPVWSSSPASTATNTGSTPVSSMHGKLMRSQTKRNPMQYVDIYTHIMFVGAKGNGMHSTIAPLLMGIHTSTHVLIFHRFQLL
jgi:hypothetical protein